MSRSEKRRKNENRERLRSMATTQLGHARRTSDGIDRAVLLIEHNDWQTARATLEECERLQPGRTEVLQLLLDVYQEQGDYASYCRTCPRLIAKDPHNRALHLNLATAYQSDRRLATSLAALRRYVARWPDDWMADSVREFIDVLAPVVEEILRISPFPAEESLELAVLHEEVMAGLASADFERTILVGEQLLARCPEYVSVMNNLAIAYYERGRTDDALAMARRVLDREPDNFHALANIARLLLLSGRHSDAEPYFERLRKAQSDHSDVWVKKAEVFSYLGDDQAVLEALAGALRSKLPMTGSPDTALLYHLAAVAHARQGHAAAAQQHWRKSLEMRPGVKLTQENLADAQRPVALREGPWAYTLNYWIHRDVMAELRDEFKSADPSNGEFSDHATFSRIAARHPEIVSLIPLLLDRGDQLSRVFACRFAKVVDTPELREALRVFCLSARGPDKMRISLADYLLEKRVIPEGPVRLWLKGEWQEFELLGFELTDEPKDGGYSHPQTMGRLNDAAEALARRDAGTAERLYLQCLTAEGDRPTLLYNLATTYQMQGRKEEGGILCRQIHERWPDYFFGSVAMATLAFDARDFDRAAEILGKLRHRRRLHHAEFSALCVAYIQLFIASRNFDGARGWLSIWKNSQPDHPRIAELERLLKLTGAVQ